MIPHWALVPLALHFPLLSLSDAILLFCPLQSTTAHSLSIQEKELKFEKQKQFKGDESNS